MARFSNSSIWRHLVAILDSKIKLVHMVDKRTFGQATMESSMRFRAHLSQNLRTGGNIVLSRIQTIAQVFQATDT